MIVKCLFVFFGLLHGFTEGQQACQPPLGEPSCVCETPDGAIDLTSLSSHDGSPRYHISIIEMMISKYIILQIHGCTSGREFTISIFL